VDSQATGICDDWQVTRYQYKIVNLGTVNAMERMLGAFADLGADGWQLVATYDKASNWFPGMEKGFVLFMRVVPSGEEPWASRYSASDESGDGFNPW
jgi:hypothetical protein